MKLSLNFLDKMDYAIFKGLNPQHQPATVKAVKKAFWAFLSIMLVVWLVQMGVKDKDTEDAILCVLFILVVGYLFYSLWPTIKAFQCWWKGFLYAIYLFVVFMLMMQLSMWAFFGLVALGVFYLINLLFLKPKNEVWHITHADGREEDVETSGFGALGSQRGKDKDGNDIQIH